MNSPAVRTLDELSRILAELINGAESGEWGRLESLVAEYSVVTDTLMASESKERNPADNAQLARVLQLHERATQLCQDRLQQITPLVNALTVKKPGNTVP